MTKSLDDRKRQILFAVINDYITTAIPVASKTICNAHSIDLSPATIRSVMADLENMGLLYHPHTSAGRIPTTEGYKYYAESMIKVKNNDSLEKDLLNIEFFKEKDGFGDLMEETSKILSNISNYAGIVLSPGKNKSVFKHIQFIRLRGKRLLAVLVTKDGSVENKIIEVEEDINKEELNQIHNYLNSILHGLTLKKVKEKILLEMKREKSQYDKLLKKAITLGHKTLKEEHGSKIYLEGEVNLVDQPEFKDIGKIKSILKALERKTFLLEILEKTLEAEGIQIFIGAEVIDPTLKDLSIITSRYVGEDGVLGTLGVIGPTRMNYTKIIPLVDYTAKFLSKLLVED